jgi:hypothetical protein
MTRTRKTGISRLSNLQRQQLLWPFLGSNIVAFHDDAHRRRCWDDNREALMSAAAPDKPNGWLIYENPDAEDAARYRASAKGGLERP